MMSSTWWPRRAHSKSSTQHGSAGSSSPNATPFESTSRSSSYNNTPNSTPHGSLSKRSGPHLPLHDPSLPSFAPANAIQYPSQPDRRKRHQDHYGYPSSRPNPIATSLAHQSFPGPSSSSHTPTSHSQQSSTSSGTIRPKTAQPRPNGSLTLGGIFSIGKSKRPSTATGTNSAPFHADSTVVITKNVKENEIQSTINSTSTRHRTNTISSSASSFNPHPLTPASITEADSTPMTRIRSNSTNSCMSPSLVIGSADYLPQYSMGEHEEGLDVKIGSKLPASMPKKAMQLPSLGPLEEYDPFAPNSISFYSPVTPPAVAPTQAFSDKQGLQPPAPQTLSVPYSTLDNHGGVSRSRSGSHSPLPAGIAVGALRLPRRPSAPTYPSAAIRVSTVGNSTNETGPPANSSTVKMATQLPFRARTLSAQSSNDNGHARHSHGENNRDGSSLLPSRMDTHLRPVPLETRRPSSGASSLNSSQDGVNSTHGSAMHLPLAYNLSNPRLSDPPSLYSPSNPRSTLSSESSNSSSFRRPEAPQRPPPPPPLSPPSDPTPTFTTTPSKPQLPRYRAANEEDARSKRIKDALEASLQELENDLGGSNRNSAIDLDMHVDDRMANALRSFGEDSEQIGTVEGLKVRARGAGSQMLLDGSRADAVETEDGSYELWIPPKPPFHAEALGSPNSHKHIISQYGAPSFIGEPLASPGFFASPYPSGVTTLPHHFWALKDDKYENEGNARDAVIPFGLHTELPSPPLPGTHPMNIGHFAPLSLPIAAVEDKLPPYQPPIRSTSIRLPATSQPPLKSLAPPAEISTPSGNHSPILDIFPTPPPSNSLYPLHARSNPSRGSSPSPLTIPSSDLRSRSRSGTLQPSTSPAVLSPSESLTSSPSMSPLRTSNTRSRSRNRALTNISDATMSTLSFSSEVSLKQLLQRGPSAAAFTETDEMADDDSDLDSSFIDHSKPPSSRLVTRASNSTSARSSPAGASITTSFGGPGTSGGSGSASDQKAPTPPSPRRKLVKENREAPGSPPTPKQHHSYTYHYTRRPRTSSSASTSLPSLFSDDVPRPSTAHSGPVSSFGAGISAVKSLSSTILPLPRRRRSFNNSSGPTPPLPLRHCSSFNPLPGASQPDPPSNSSHTGATASSSTTHNNESHPSLGRKGSTSGKRRLMNRPGSKASITKGLGFGALGSIGSSGSIHGHGPKGERDREFDWTKEKTRYPPDDDMKSLMTLNRFPGRLSEDDSALDWWDDMPSGADHNSTSHPRSSPTHTARTISATKASKSTSPVRSEYRAMYIIPPSELVKLGDQADGHDMSESQSPALSQEDDLIRGNTLDELMAYNSTAGQADKTWLSEMGVSPVSKLYHASSMSAIKESQNSGDIGRSASSPILPTRNLLPPRPSTGGRTDPNPLNPPLGPPPQQKRPSSQETPTPSLKGFSLGQAQRAGPGSPLSPPPLRSRIPRSSISSSLRSLPLAPSNSSNPLSPPPARARALSGSEGAAPGVRTVVPNHRRGSDAVPVTTATAPSSPTTARPAHQGHLRRESSYGSIRTLKRNESLLSKHGTIRKNRHQSIKAPSFLDIDFEDEMDEGYHRSTATFTIRPKGITEDASELDVDSFLDMSRGSMDHTMDEAVRYR